MKTPMNVLLTDCAAGSLSDEREAFLLDLVGQDKAVVLAALIDFVDVEDCANGCDVKPNWAMQLVMEIGS